MRFYLNRKTDSKPHQLFLFLRFAVSKEIDGYKCLKTFGARPIIGHYCSLQKNCLYHFWYCLWFPTKWIVRLFPSSLKQILHWPVSTTKYGRPSFRRRVLASVFSCWIFFQIRSCSALSILQ